jgi:hypothetical protein
MTVIKARTIKDSDVLDCDYVCNFCGMKKTNVKVRKSGKSGKTQDSTQIKCINCGNFLKTYE